jgi:hypothetical protein
MVVRQASVGLVFALMAMHDEASNPLGCDGGGSSGGDGEEEGAKPASMAGWVPAHHESGGSDEQLGRVGAMSDDKPGQQGDADGKSGVHHDPPCCPRQS